MWQSPESRPSLSAVADYAPEAIVRTDLNGMIVAANAAFLGMVQASSDASVRGEFLDRWLGGAGVDLRVLMANARQHGVMRRFSTTLRDAQDHQVDVELAAVSLPEETVPGFGFLIREVPRSHALGTDAGEIGRVGGRSVDQLTELVGRVPLKELVREAADVIERLAIEAALKLTADNRALASDLLGLSRQSLYIKLHRYGLGDLEADAALPSPTTVESSKAARPGQGGAVAKKKGAAPTGASSRRSKAVSPPAPPPRGKQRG
jgi:transcriptional regulator PpsR